MTTSRQGRGAKGSGAIRATGRITSSSRPAPRLFSGARRVWLPGLAVALGAGLLVQQNHLLVADYINRPVSRVRLDTPLQNLGEAEVQAMLSDFMDAGYFTLDVAGIRSRLESHPWVARATVRKLWPDGLALELGERVPIARWGEAYLLDQDGVLFRPAPNDTFGTLPRLDGPEGSQLKLMEHYRLIRQVLVPSGLQLVGLRMSRRGSWDLTLNDGMQVAAGRTAVIDRLRRFVEFHSTRGEADGLVVEYVDLRYDNGIAVRTAPAAPPEVAVR